MYFVAKMTSVTYGSIGMDGMTPAGFSFGMPKRLGILFGSVVLVPLEGFLDMASL
jgi:hypothetical protein